MTIFLVELPESGGQSRTDGTKAMLIEADTALEARELAASQELADADWTDSTVTATDVTSLTASDYLGWRWVVKITDPVTGAPVAEAEYTGIASDTVDLAGAALVIALNLLGNIANAAYVSPTLTAAGTGDTLGDQALEMDVFPPGAKAPMPNMTGAITDEGASGAALTVALDVPTIIPTLGREL